MVQRAGASVSQGLDKHTGGKKRNKQGEKGLAVMVEEIKNTKHDIAMNYDMHTFTMHFDVCTLI